MMKSISNKKEMVSQHLDIAKQLQVKALNSLDGIAEDKINVRDAAALLKMALELESQSRERAAEFEKADSQRGVRRVLVAVRAAAEGYGDG
jgi:hypothetical protein